MSGGFKSIFQGYILPEIRNNKIVFISICMFLTGFFLIVCLTQYTFIEKLSVTKFVAFFSVIGLLIPKNTFFRKKKISSTEYYLLNFFGYGPFITGLLMLINLIFSFNPEISTHNIIHHELKNTFSINSPLYVVRFDDGFLVDFESFRTVNIEDMPPSPQTVTYSISTGLFNVKVLNWQDVE